MTSIYQIYCLMILYKSMNSQNYSGWIKNCWCTGLGEVWWFDLTGASLVLVGRRLAIVGRHFISGGQIAMQRIPFSCEEIPLNVKIIHFGGRIALFQWRKIEPKFICAVIVVFNMPNPYWSFSQDNFFSLLNIPDICLFFSTHTIFGTIFLHTKARKLR